MRAKMLDIMACAPQDGQDAELIGSGDMADIAGADVVAITAGVPRGPGMSREDLLDINLKIIRNVAQAVKQHAPNAFVVITTNPLDSIVYAFHKESGLPHSQIAGMAGALDSARFKAFIAQGAGVSVKDVACLVMGGHGPTMIPLVRTATIGGVPIRDILTTEQIAEIVEHTRNAGTEIVKLMEHGSAFYSAAAAVAQMVEAFILDKKRVIPSAVYCQGQFAIEGYFVGVPAVIGSSGVESIIEFKLNTEEQKMLDITLAAVKESVAKL
jgi:malate dehydrogenase